MASLITKTVADNPKILIISEDFYFTSLLIEYFEENSLNVDLVDPAVFVLKFNEYHLEEYYKIVLIYGFNKFGKDLFINLIRKINHYYTYLLCIINIFDSFSVEENRTYQLILKFLSELDIPIYLSKNVITEENSYFLDKIVISRVENCYQSSPEKINLLTEASLAFYIKNDFFNPNKDKKQLLQGQEIEFNKMLEILKESNSSFFEKLNLCKSHLLQINQVKNFKSRILETRVGELLFLYQYHNFLKEQPKENLDVKQVAKTKPLIPELKKENNKVTSLPQVNRGELQKNLPEKTKARQRLVKINNFKDKRKADKDSALLSIKKTDLKIIDNLIKRDDLKLENIFRDSNIEIRAKSRFKQNKNKTLPKIKFLKQWLILGLCLISTFLMIYLFSSFYLSSQLKNLNPNNFSLYQKFFKINQKQTQLLALCNISYFNQETVFLAALERYLEASQNLVDSYTLLQNFLIYSLDQKELDLTDLYNQNKLLLSKAYENLAFYEMKRGELNFNELKQNKKDILLSLDEESKRRKKQLLILEQVNDLIKIATTDDQNHILAMILKDNQQLTESGGKISALGLLNFKKGKLINYEFYQDIDIDEKIYGFISPPEELQYFSPKAEWLFRDANYHPEFSYASKSISWFINESLQLKPEGIIALDLEFLTNYLKVIKTLKLEEINQDITNENIAEYFEGTLDEAMENNSKFKEKYSKAILLAFFKSLKNLNQIEFSQVLELITTSFMKKSLMISAENSEIQKILKILAWNGDFLEVNCPIQFGQKNCLVDPFYYTESNLNQGRQVNLEKIVSHNIKLSESMINHEFNLKLKNTEATESSKLINLYIPKNDLYQEIVDDGQVVSREDIVVSYKINELKSFTTKIVMPPNSEKNLIFKYKANLPYKDNYAYLFFVNKQTGLNPYPITVNINSQDLTPKTIMPQAKYQEGTATFQDTLDQNKFFSLDF